MAIDPPVTQRQIEVAAQMQREASTSAEERRVWTEDQMHKCVSAPGDLIPPLLMPPLGGQTASAGVVKQKHSHYYKDVSQLDFIDVYRVLHLFNVTDPCIQHAVKKLLVAGGRGAGKDITKDVRESIDSLARFLEMRDEESDEYAAK
jgi:hypothetical protein